MSCDQYGKACPPNERAQNALTVQRIAQTMPQHPAGALQLGAPTAADACARWRCIACSDVSACLTSTDCERHPAAIADPRTWSAGLTAACGCVQTRA